MIINTQFYTKYRPRVFYVLSLWRIYQILKFCRKSFWIHFLFVASGFFSLLCVAVFCLRCSIAAVVLLYRQCDLCSGSSLPRMVVTPLDLSSSAHVDSSTTSIIIRWSERWSQKSRSFLRIAGSHEKRIHPPSFRRQGLSKFINTTQWTVSPSRPINALQTGGLGCKTCTYVLLLGLVGEMLRMRTLMAFAACYTRCGAFMTANKVLDTPYLYDTSWQPIRRTYLDVSRVLNSVKIRWCSHSRR